MIRGSEILHNIGLSILYIMQDQIFMMRDFCKLLFIFKIKILE